MAYTEAQLQRLIDLRSTGRLSIKEGDRTVTFQSGADLDAAIRAARQDVAASSGVMKRRHYPEFHRGH